MKRDDLTEALRFPRVTLLLQNPHIFRVRPLIPTQLFSVLSFFSTGGRRQADHTSKTTAQNAKNNPNRRHVMVQILFFWYATVYAQPAQALAMFAPDVFPLSLAPSA